ncbi:hypothetical protein BD310DRAFT_361525 [Dichomitus squalens]|uniref:Uncharacterized protein n=1 Tax=Dichomitus squalens TaxID=114155 RepID=A0A4Q9PZT9_9APHY|nr:hypothetical protein BD310DRAFT_361525 [Dichomitus squalens]
MEVKGTRRGSDRRIVVVALRAEAGFSPGSWLSPPNLKIRDAKMQTCIFLRPSPTLPSQQPVFNHSTRPSSPQNRFQISPGFVAAVLVARHRPRRPALIRPADVRSPRPDSPPARVISFRHHFPLRADAPESATLAPRSTPLLTQAAYCFFRYSMHS